MSSWTQYEARLKAKGVTKRERDLIRSQNHLGRKVPNSLSSKSVLVNGDPQRITVLNLKEDFSKKRITSLPGETIPHGGIIDYQNAKWLVTELEADSELYMVGTMERCNYLLRWIDENGHIIERWSIVEDGTKYLIGEKSGKIMSIGDARIALTVGKDKDTAKIARGRRFLVDDLDSSEVLAYQVTKPNRLYNIYNGEGVYRYILNEVNLTDNDNVGERIADYYNWEPPKDLDIEHSDKDISLDEIVTEAIGRPEPSDDREVWL